MQNLDISTIVFAIVAIFVVFKLRSVLGTRSGAERPPVDRTPPRGPSDFKSAPAGGNVISLGLAAKPAGQPDEAGAVAERWKGFAEPGSTVAAGFDAIAAADRGFAPASFLSRRALGLRDGRRRLSPQGTCRPCAGCSRPTFSPISTKRFGRVRPPGKR